MSEADLLAHIRDRSRDLAGHAGAFGQIVVGPGDDCAVIQEAGANGAPGGLLVIGVDQLIEGRHYESGTEIDLIARKAVARAVSDIAAMGARPCWGLATGLLPAGYPDGDALFDAMAKWARHWGCPLIGGDIASGSPDDTQPAPLSLTVTVAGRMKEGVNPVLRSGAQPGDELWLTGQIGGSFESGWHLRFEPRIEAGLAAARSGRATAMLDISDGVGTDASRLGTMSGVRLDIDATKLPISHRCSDWRSAVSEGEDYELLIAASPGECPPFATEPPLLGPVGVVRACEEGETPGATMIDPHGVAHDASELGWDHG